MTLLVGALAFAFALCFASVVVSFPRPALLGLSVVALLATWWARSLWMTSAIVGGWAPGDWRTIYPWLAAAVVEIAALLFPRAIRSSLQALPLTLKVGLAFAVPFFLVGVLLTIAGPGTLAIVPIAMPALFAVALAHSNDTGEPLVTVSTSLIVVGLLIALFGSGGY